MARPKSEEKRTAILDAATAAIATGGVAAPTSQVAKKAGVSEGTLFNYFATKSDLHKSVYLHIKAELFEQLTTSFPEHSDMRSQVSHLWTRYLEWGLSYPLKRAAIARLELSSSITEETKKAGWAKFADVIAIIERSSFGGALDGQPMAYTAALMDSIASTTIDFMIKDPKNAESYHEAGFLAYWNALTSAPPSRSETRRAALRG